MKDQRHTQNISLANFQKAKGSVRTRLTRLRKNRGNWRFPNPDGKTPIARIDAFKSDINEMERILDGMNERLENAEITIKI